MAKSLNLSLTVAVRLLSCLVLISAAHAEIIDVEVVVKSVDNEGRSITVERKGKQHTLDVSRKAKVSSGDSTLTLTELRAGDEVIVSYETTFGVVTAVSKLSGGMSAGESKQAAWLHLKQLNADRTANQPWISPDGKSIYFERGGIWTSDRKDADSPFEKPRQIMSRGSVPTLTADGLEVFVCDKSPIPGETTLAIYTSKRVSVEELFPEPKLVRELVGVKGAWNPSVSPDGLTLYFDAHDSSSGEYENIMYSTRASREATWSNPRPLPIESDGVEGPLMWPFVTNEGRLLFCRGPAGPMVWARDTTSAPFSEYRLLDLPEEPICFFVRYSPETNELFINRRNETGLTGIWVLQNFDLARHSRKSAR